MAREILLVRHGEAYNSVEPDGMREVSDRSNPPLTPRGEAQAEAVARRVEQFAPDRVVASPFLRTSQTAFAYLELADALGATDVRLSEHFMFRSLLDFPGVDLDDHQARFADRLSVAPELATREAFPAFPESDASVLARASDLVDEWLARDDWSRLALFCHWATVVAVTRAFLPEADFEPMHCSVTHLVEEEDGSWRAIDINASDHLPEQLRTL